MRATGDLCLNENYDGTFDTATDAHANDAGWTSASDEHTGQKSVDRGDRKTHKSVEEKLRGHLREQRIAKSRGALIIARRARLKSLYRRDEIEIENSIRALGYGFIPTQP